MLTIKDLRINLLEISLHSKLNIIPLRFLSSTSTFVIINSPWRKFLSRVQLALFATQVVISNYTFLESLVFPEYFTVRHFLFHLSTAATSPVSLFWHFTYWIRWPNETAMLFNYSFPTECANRKELWTGSVEV